MDFRRTKHSLVLENTASFQSNVLPLLNLHGIIIINSPQTNIIIMPVLSSY